MQQDQARKAQAAALANGQQKQQDRDRAQNRHQEAEPSGRSDTPWLHKGIIVKVILLAL